MILSEHLPQDIPTGAEPYFDVRDPATEETVAHVHDSAAEEWDAALAAAVEAQAAWAKVSPRERAVILTDMYRALVERTEDLARTITLEMGKPLAEARGEVAYGAEYFRWFAEEAVRLPGRFSPSPSGAGDILVTRTPVGPVLAITPWNFPLAMATRKIAPALAAGCPILVKPASETPLTMLLAGKIITDVLAEAAAPEALVSILPTTDDAGLSSRLMADERLRKITFTGSTAVGKLLVRQSADNLLRSSMELGGNAPFLINADADLDRVLTCAMQAKMRNGGEACVAANRFLVHEHVAEEFTRRLVESMAALRPGHGLEEDSTLGPVITAKQRDRIAELVDDALAAGATALTGGGSDAVAEGPGHFYPATVLTDVPADARILHAEIFGPVATVVTFADLDEGIALANDTEYGLAAYGFSDNIDTCRRLATELTAGMVGINRGMISDAAAPFGGVKQSGFGREGGTEGIEEYLDTRYVAL
ncbi:NAD-dependent succinate-semialdehyde dehydrogenase [Corynebacterium frankenforstense]|uniref:NAD-dependent succinate-semialdehyde dehydrogenase n=1 Tax=Corynebacterium TaxID=1716 RepID=UPI002550BB69|nr:MULTISPECIES: NAD-dependent succinate-semialdehyde dehydrogenase [Corynebacterium]MDK6259619.1 NAD-dependent succinate-semialdehyde dehydrogenase [Corynebacterium frankenforstense]MDK8894817.1 NAD-dependent succinate-semialdehyde dehydrogenase [Corynebacterium sp. MSK006]